MAAPTPAPCELREIIDHVFLLPKLLQRKDEPRDSSFVMTTLEALYGFRDVATEGSQALGRAAMALDALLNINSFPDGFTCQKAFEKTLSSLRNGNVMAVKIKAQNPAVMITKRDDTVVFEEFELSARNSDVVGTRAKSRRPRNRDRGRRVIKDEEERDTTHPGLVSELVVGGILKGSGATVTVRSISKQTRDEVLWDNAHLPWRRSAI
ncbi:hypothetical protein LTR17_021320 [Elasticomyces elasticus]|nr:hypothetical protein LTR17_021320 [Elasticomyces elasticus]